MNRRSIAALVFVLLLAPATLAGEGKKLGRAMITYYWIADESAPRYRGRPDAVIRDARGAVIAHTSRKFRKALIVEGTGWLRDGRTVMYDQKVHGEHRFRVVRTRYGLAITGCPLIPYRTVAVDPHFIRLGSTIYVPQLKGARLPDGTVHDGIFFATDRGHFRGRHIDIFVGAGVRAARPFLRKGYHSRAHVTIFIESGGSDCGR